MGVIIGYGNNYTSDMLQDIRFDFSFVKELDEDIDKDSTRIFLDHNCDFLKIDCFLPQYKEKYTPSNSINKFYIGNEPYGYCKYTGDWLDVFKMPKSKVIVEVLEDTTLGVGYCIYVFNPYFFITELFFKYGTLILDLLSTDEFITPFIYDENGRCSSAYINIINMHGFTGHIIDIFDKIWGLFLFCDEFEFLGYTSQIQTQIDFSIISDKICLLVNRNQISAISVDDYY